MPIPIPHDLSPVSGSDGSPCKDKVSRWRQSLLSTLPRERSRAYAVGAVAAQNLAAWSEQDSLTGWPGWLATQAPSAKRKAPIAGDRCHSVSKWCGKDEGGSDAEEEAWEHYRRKTGLVAKLVIYDSSQRLLGDFQLRSGLRKSGAVVLNVLPGGLCDRAGVRAGDRLVSINGRQDANLRNLKVEELPMKLIFMGTSGKITTEVRLVSGDNTLTNKGFTLLSDKVWGGTKTKYLFQEERVFVPSLASLALGVQAEPVSTPQMFSLERAEAAHLLRCAKNEAQARLRGEIRAQKGTVFPGAETEVEAAELSQQELWVEVGARPASPEQEEADDRPIGPKKEWSATAVANVKELNGDLDGSETEVMEAEMI